MIKLQKLKELDQDQIDKRKDSLNSELDTYRNRLEKEKDEQKKEELQARIDEIKAELAKMKADQSKKKATESIRNISPQWNTLIGMLDDFRYRIYYEKNSEWYDDYALLNIDGIGKEEEEISVWIDTLDYIHRILSRYYKIKYTWKVINHQSGFTIQINRIRK
jgi:hypothetical protein